MAAKARGRPPDDAPAPDSTTGAPFAAGQDVLLKQRDGRFYFGTVVEVDAGRDRCRVKFGDGTDSWSPYRDLTRLSASERELLCVVCKRSAPKDGREIEVCDRCSRGYHRKCHQPEIPDEERGEDSIWLCKRCLSGESHRLKKNNPKHLRREPSRNVVASSSSDSTFVAPITKVLPYEINSLTWDTYHRVNDERKYCYCGENGEWYRQMLQCGRCKQWFHEGCLDCLQYPLYCGDRFYVFVCSLCNHGKEFLRRLEVKWVDLVHLMLFNLTAYNSKKYYDLDTIIIPYINDNWHALQLPPKIASVTKAERRENILSILTNNRNRFKCGREIKKRTTIWGLRVRLPPPAPSVTLPPAGPLSDDELREMWQGNRRLQFLAPPPCGGDDAGVVVVPSDAHMRALMAGLAYQGGNPSETDSPCPSPETAAAVAAAPPPRPFAAAGCAKKTVPPANVSRRGRRATEEEGGGTEGLPPTPPTSVSAPPTPPASGSNSLMSDELSEPLGKNAPGCGKLAELNNDTSGDETSSKSTLDLIIPPPKDFEGKNNPFLTLLRGNDDRPKKRKSKDSITLPLPLTAVIPGKPLMRPTKRQLSEKDIFIGPNGEVKRRRLRRSRCHQLAASYTMTASKTATVLPVRPDAKEWKSQSATSNNGQIANCVDYALNGRRLRQRPEKQQEKEKISPQPSSKPSPVKNEPDISMDELKSSVNIYFGAANRIAAGERYAVKAKRIGPSGKLEFLIEWEGPGNGMT